MYCLIILQHLFSYVVVQQPARHDRPLLRSIIVAFIRLGVRVVVQQRRLRLVVVGLLTWEGLGGHRPEGLWRDHLGDAPIQWLRGAQATLASLLGM